MLTRRWDKSRMPSRHVTVGPGRAPHRSYYYAMGLTEDEIDQPFVGVATCWNEAAPCNIALARQAQSVKKGVNGLAYRYYEGAWKALPDFDTAAVVRRGIAYTFALDEAGPRNESFGLAYGGYLDVGAPGEYTFTLGSDDGSRLLIDGKTVVENDGLHAYAEERGSVNLTAGKHAIAVTYFQAGGGKRLEVRYAGPGIPEQPVPPGKLFIAP